jgi:hypothetical protein
MAKALIGYLDSDPRTPLRLAADNARLRARVGELESLVLRLQEENDALVSTNSASLLAMGAPLSDVVQEMQPA